MCMSLLGDKRQSGLDSYRFPSSSMCAFGLAIFMTKLREKTISCGGSFIAPHLLMNS